MTGAHRSRLASPPEPSLPERIATFDWPRLATDLDTQGSTVINAVLAPQECVALVETDVADESFRSRIVMAQHAFGRGEYQYFGYPLPAVVAGLRTALYAPLASGEPLA